jgi:gliding motility-associated lipoprotein GldH
MMNLRHIIQLIVLAGILFSCDTKRIYEDYYNIDPEGWHKDSIASFNFSIDDTIQYYNLLINTRNLEAYSYSNLWLFVDVIAPDSTVFNDTVEFRLAQPNGKWLGKGSGGVYLCEFMFRTNIFFPETGDYKIKLQHGMRDEKLAKLKDIGIRIEKSN